LEGKEVLTSGRVQLRKSLRRKIAVGRDELRLLNLPTVSTMQRVLPFTLDWDPKTLQEAALFDSGSLRHRASQHGSISPNAANTPRLAAGGVV